jgi:hypothetical protein
MSLVDQLFGWIVDFGDYLPRRARQIVGITFVLVIAAAPSFYIGIATRYAEHRARGVIAQVIRSLPSTTQVTSRSRLGP